MRIHKSFVALGLLIAFVLFFELLAHADAGNEQTKITLDTLVQIPGRVLPARTYTFQRMVISQGLHLVQIFNADQAVLYATLDTMPVNPAKATNHTAPTLAQRPGQPDLLVRWFYPGSTTGNEFMYPKQQQKEVTHATQQTAVTDQATSGFKVID
jgi:hypothetical protein